MKAIYLTLTFAAALMFAGTALAHSTTTNIDGETSLCGGGKGDKKGGDTFCGGGKGDKKGGDTFCGGEKKTPKS